METGAVIWQSHLILIFKPASTQHKIKSSLQSPVIIMWSQGLVSFTITAQACSARDARVVYWTMPPGLVSGFPFSENPCLPKYRKHRLYCIQDVTYNLCTQTLEGNYSKKKWTHLFLKTPQGPMKVSEIPVRDLVSHISVFDTIYHHRLWNSTVLRRVLKIQYIRYT